VWWHAQGFDCGLQFGSCTAPAERSCTGDERAASIAKETIVDLEILEQQLSALVSAIVALDERIRESDFDSIDV
jgi:hypothetical protein